MGCPHAARTRKKAIDYPASVSGKQGQYIELSLSGCSFCDVAMDKGFCGRLDMETVLSQIQCLPQAQDGRKIPFELINENPLPNLPELLQEVAGLDDGLTQVTLTLRADYFIAGAKYFREALGIADELGIYILLSSIGFESFDDAILRNLNKGLTVEKNLQAIRLLRQLKEEFPHQMGYSSKEGAIHGFIHPTPWDTKEITARIQKTMSIYGLPNDILPKLNKERDFDIKDTVRSLAGGRHPGAVVVKQPSLGEKHDPFGRTSISLMSNLQNPNSLYYVSTPNKIPFLPNYTIRHVMTQFGFLQNSVEFHMKYAMI